MLFQVGTAEPAKKIFFLSSKTRAQQSNETRLPGGESSGWEEALAGVGEGEPQNESLYDVKRFLCESVVEKPCKGEKKNPKASRSSGPLMRGNGEWFQMTTYPLLCLHA